MWKEERGALPEGGGRKRKKANTTQKERIYFVSSTKEGEGD